MIDYLVAHDVETIHVLIPSHAHKDHMGACPAVMKTFKVGTAYHDDSDAATRAWKAFRKAAEMHAHEIIPVNENMQTDLLQILVAYDGRDRSSKEADNSILVLLVDGDVRVLLPGDCEAVCKKAVSPHLKRIDVLNVGHHGSNAQARTTTLGIRPSPCSCA